MRVRVMQRYFSDGGGGGRGPSLPHYTINHTCHLHIYLSIPPIKRFLFLHSKGRGEKDGTSLQIWSLEPHSHWAHESIIIHVHVPVCVQRTYVAYLLGIGDQTHMYVRITVR